MEHIYFDNHDIIVEQSPIKRITLADVLVRIVVVSVLLSIITLVASHNDKVLPMPSAKTIHEMCKHDR